MEKEKQDLIQLVRALCKKHLNFGDEFAVVTVYSDLEVIPPSDFESFPSEEVLKSKMDKLNQALKNETDQIFKIGGYGHNFSINDNNTVKLSYFTVVVNQ